MTHKRLDLGFLFWAVGPVSAQLPAGTLVTLRPST